MVKGPLCQLVHYLITLNGTMAWHPAEADTCAFVTQSPENVHDVTNERVCPIFALNCLQAKHWVRVEYNIVLYRIAGIVQCQVNGCSLSSKDGTVIRESFRQLSAGRITILEMAVDRCCPHPLVNLRTVCVNWIRWLPLDLTDKSTLVAWRHQAITCAIADPGLCCH